MRVTHVLRGGAAEAAGLAAGDELLGVEGWRLRRLDDAAPLLPAKGSARLLASRDQRVELSIATPSTAAGAVQLALDEGASAASRALRKAWLHA